MPVTVVWSGTSPTCAPLRQSGQNVVMATSHEAWLHNAHISHYSHGNRFNHDPNRPRKLLLHREEIRKLIGKTREKGLALIPLRFYLKKGRVKCELALAKGKKHHDKRQAERARTAENEARDAIRNRR